MSQLYSELCKISYFKSYKTKGYQKIVSRGHEPKGGWATKRKKTNGEVRVQHVSIVKLKGVIMQL